MRKILFVFLIIWAIVPVQAEILVMDNKNPLNNKLFIDEGGLYRYKRGQDMYEKECQDIYSEEMKKKCMEAERAVWARKRPLNDVEKEGTLFTGKIKEENSYFNVIEGVKGPEIHLLLKHLYFERGDDQDVLYDIRTEGPYSGKIVIGGVERLSPEKGKGDRFIASQKYTDGLPDGTPTLQMVDEKEVK